MKVVTKNRTLESGMFMEGRVYEGEGKDARNNSEASQMPEG